MTTSLRKRFGSQIKQLRLALGVSQEAFADRCGFERSYMSRIERGIANPSLDAIEVLASALEVEVKQLFDYTVTHKDADEPLLVPFAADGSCFHPGLASPRTHTYKVGEKDKPIRFVSFEEALDYLRSMNTAKWWRPNASGTWGLVTATHWDRLPTQSPRPAKDA